jgi:hypothetical protein
MKSSISLLIVFSIFLIGCEAPIDLELDDSETGVIVIEALLRDVPETDYVKVSKTTSFYEENGEDLVSNALVLIEDESGVSISLKESNHPDSVGYYIKPKNYQFKDKENYTLSVTTDGETYSASSQFNLLLPIDSMEVFYDEIQFLFASPAFPIPEEDTLYNIDIIYSENNRVGDGYLFRYYVNDSLTSVNPRDLVFFDDEFLEEGSVAGSVQQLNKGQADYGDEITIEMLSVHPDLITFYEVLFSQTDLSGNLFASSPPANVPTNFSNGARGFFQVSDVQFESTTFKPLYKE